jgi:hypothetical protein
MLPSKPQTGPSLRFRSCPGDAGLRRHLFPPWWCVAGPEPAPDPPSAWLSAGSPQTTVFSRGLAAADDFDCPFAETTRELCQLDPAGFPPPDGTVGRKLRIEKNHARPLECYPKSGFGAISRECVPSK